MHESEHPRQVLRHAMEFRKVICVESCEEAERYLIAKHRKEAKQIAFDFTVDVPQIRKWPSEDCSEERSSWWG
jgi:hypothetical protein